MKKKKNKKVVSRVQVDVLNRILVCGRFVIVGFLFLLILGASVTTSGEFFEKILRWSSLNWPIGYIILKEMYFLFDLIFLISNYFRGTDEGGITLIFLFLNSIIFLGVKIYNNNSTQIVEKKTINRLFLLLELSIIFCILVKDMVLFYIGFEISLIIFFFLIYIVGSRTRKIHATYMLILYTLIGSLFLIAAIVIFFKEFGTSDITLIKEMEKDKTRDMLLFFLLLIGFAVKIPIFPLHLWLLEAHVEAHTTTSVVLAAMILKLGGIGMIKFMLPFSYAAVGTIYLSIAVIILIIGLIVCGLAILQQVDLKKMIAYSSILHMNFSMISILMLNKEGIIGCVISMFAHGLTAAGLFFCVGMIYERYGTRNILAYGGLVYLQPIFSIYLFLLLLTNASFPFSLNFIGEMHSFFGIQEHNLFLNISLVILVTSTVILSFWIIVRVIFGNKLTKDDLLGKSKDLAGYEIIILQILISFNLLFGTILSGPLIELIKSTITTI
jgi:NADH-quinone oxidoreductase subunit M